MPTKKKGRGWTEERRKKQAEAIRRWKPWENSTGPKSAAGKSRSSMNAYKHGGRDADMRMLHEALAHQKEFLRLVMIWERNRLLKDLHKQLVIRQRARCHQTD